jgi:hypothetical protein
MEYFVQIMDLNNIGYLCVIVPRVSDTKIKAEIFIGPQMRELMKDEIFNIRAEIEPLEKVAWECFPKSKAENYRDLVHELLNSHKALGYNMSLLSIMYVLPATITVRDFTKRYRT